ncbi:MAG TPA: tandem-95 repeat protein, partial [Ilumatobacteraceae bacterium]
MSARRMRRPVHHDRGFTLVELIMTMVLGAMIAGVVLMALLTSLNVADSTTAQVNDSTDAGLISAFLIRDAQSAGGIDPASATADPSLGASTSAIDGDGVACTPSPAALVLRLSWLDRTVAAAPTKFVVSYAITASDPLDSTKLELTRRQCAYHEATVDMSDVVLARSVNTATASCDFETGTTESPICAGRPATVSLHVAGSGERAPFDYTLTAALRTAASQLTIIAPSSLPDGLVGVAYASNVVTTIGAAAPTAWSQNGLPAPLEIDSASGVIFGIPTSAGQFPVTITVTDALGAKASRVYTLVIHEPPHATPDSFSVNEDSVFAVAAPGVLNGDSSPEGKPITAVLYSGVANGSVTLAANGGFIYTPNPDFYGTDAFQYKASDGSLESTPVTVTLTVNAINDAPRNQVPVGQETMKNTNKVFSSPSNRISVSDVDVGPGTLRVTLTASNGTLTLPTKTGLTFSVGDGTSDPTMTFTGAVANINAALTTTTFTPTANFTGTGSVQIATSDQGNTGAGGALTDTDAVTVNVTGLGIFTANKDVGDIEISGSSTFAPPSYTVKGSGWDIWENNDGFQYLYRQLTGDGSLTARVASINVTYNGVRNATKTCYAPQGTQYCESVSKAEVMIRQNVTSGAAMHASTGMTQGNGSEFIFRTTSGGGSGASGAKDSLGAPYWLRLTRRGNQFTAEISADGINWMARGTPQTIAMGSTTYIGLAVSAVYQLSGDSPSTKLNTTIYDSVSISTPPVAVGDAYLVNEDTTLALNAAAGVLTNDSDPEGDILTAKLVSGTPGLSLNADGSFSYTPPANFSGIASFSYVANDGILESPPVTVTLTVNSSNETPSFVKGPDQLVSSSAALQLVPGWATAINPGSGETGQLIDFIVTNTNPGLFSVQPAVRADGTLTFAPVGGVSGQATVSVKIHDNGGTANSGNDTSAVQTFTIIADDPPAVTTSGTALTYTENATTAADPGVTVSDADNANLASATVRISSGYQSGQDLLAFTAQNGITGSWNAASGVLTLSGTSSVGNYQAALRSVTYTNTSDNPVATSRTVSFVANDGLMASSSVGRTLVITPVNDAPTVTTTGGSMAYTENATSAVDAGLTVGDVDSANLTSATVSIDSGYQSSQDLLAFTNQNGIVGTWNAATATWTLSGSSSVANYQTALRSITYTNSSHNPSTTARTVTFVVNDGPLASNTASRAIAITPVNDAPVVSTSGGSMAYTENATSVVDSGVTL